MKGKKEKVIMIALDYPVTKNLVFESLKDAAEYFECSKRTLVSAYERGSLFRQSYFVDYLFYKVENGPVDNFQ